MALPSANTAETGLSSGTTVTIANSDDSTAGDAFADVTIGSGGARGAASPPKAHGSLSIKYTQAGTPSFTRFGWATGSVTEVYGRTYFRRTAMPSGTGAQICWVDLSGTGSCAWFDLNTSGQVRVWDSSNASQTMTTAISLDTWYRLEFHVICHATAGTVEAKLFAGDATTALETKAISGTAQTRASMTHVYFGEGWVSDANGITWFDSLQINGTAYPGPLTTPQLLRPTADSVVGAYTTQAAGTTNLYQTIDETTASDADYVQSELAPSSAVYRFKLGTGTDPNSSSGHVIRWRVGKSPSDGQVINATIRIYQGGGNSAGAGTLIKTATRNAVTSFTTYEETLSGGEADTITNYADLYGEIVATQA
jgi:hypothetical protein